MVAKIQTQKVLQAAVNWWRQHKPIRWTTTQYLSKPDVGCVTKCDVDLAKEVAKYLRDNNIDSNGVNRNEAPSGYHAELESAGCDGCAFDGDALFECSHRYQCIAPRRRDVKFVIFKKNLKKPRKK